MHSRFVLSAAGTSHDPSWLASNAGALLVGAGIVLVLMALLFTLGLSRNPQTRKLRFGIRALVSGADNRLSTSKTIVVAWTAVVAWMLVSEAIRDFAANLPLGNLPVSNDYLLLLGGPFAAAVLAKQIVTTRLANGTLAKPSAPPDAPLQLSDLVSADDGSLDLVDFQYSLFNLIALGIVVYSFIQHPAAGLPPVPSGLLAITSAAAATYVGNKAVASNTPSIARFAPGQVRPGQVTTINGSNLMASATEANFPVVTIGGVPAAVVGAPSATSVQVRVPMGLATVPGGQATAVTLVADPAGNASVDSDVMVIPDSVQITDITPSSPPAGATVVLNGAGFLDASAMPPADKDMPFDTPVVVIQVADSGLVLARIPVGQNGSVPPADSQLTITMPQVNVRALTPLKVSVTRGALTSAAVPILLGSTTPVPVAPSDLATPQTVDGTTGLKYGSGICTLNGASRDSALTFRPPSGALTFTGSTVITLCTSRDEVYTALGITAATEASYGLGSVSDKFTWAESHDMVSTSLHLVVRSAMTSAPRALTGATLATQAGNLLDNGDYVTFFQRYGDRFVSAQVVGGEYVGVLSIETLHQEDLLTVTDALEASVSAGELDVSVQTSVTNTLNQYHDQITVTFDEFAQGGDVTAAARAGGTGGGTLSAETVLAMAINFPATVTAANAFPVQAILSDYSELALPDPQAWLNFVAANILPARGVLLQIGGAIQQMQADLHQVEYVLAHPELYAPTEVALEQELTSKPAQLESQIADTTQLAADYAGSVMARGSISSVKAPVIPTPITINWPASKPVPTFRVLLAPDEQSGKTPWAVSCPKGGDATGPLVLQPRDEGDLGQQFQIPQFTEVSFSMTNVRTGLKAASSGAGAAAVQSGANGNTVLWTIAKKPEAPFLPWPVQPGQVVIASLGQSGQCLNLKGDNQQAGNPIITWDIFPVDTNSSVWTLEQVTIPATIPPQFGVKVSAQKAW